MTLGLIWATAIGIVLVIGSVVATLVISPLLTAGTNSNAAANGNAATNGSSASGAIVIAWNKELLHIVQTPGAQPATVHPTRSYPILHAPISTPIVSIPRPAPPYLSPFTPPRTPRA